MVRHRNGTQPPGVSPLRNLAKLGGWRSDCERPDLGDALGLLAPGIRCIHVQLYLIAVRVGKVK